MPRQAKSKSPKASAKRGPGAPEKEIDLKQLETLCQLQATSAELAAFFDCSVKTIERHKSSKPEFAAAMENGKLKGLISLRRAQFQAALAGNPTMLVWMGKVALGQKDPHFVRDVVDPNAPRPSVMIGMPDGTTEEAKPPNADALKAAGKSLSVQ